MELACSSLYEQVGGSETFFRLVDNFYEAVRHDEELMRMFPLDLEGPKERLALFLIQYFGGPSTYSERRGHPRLRMRHIGFAIGKRERDLWASHMLRAIERADIAEPARTQIVEYFERAATFMINAQTETADESARPASS